MSEKLKSNPYVYPFIPFEDLSNKNIKDNFTDRKNITWEDLKEIVAKIDRPEIKFYGETVAGRILSIFLDNNIRFGPREFIEDRRQFWVGKLSYFIDQGSPIQFTILGFPFKIPVPLKTDRVFPDMGEVLSLLRLKIIAETVKNVYSPGAVITIFTEGAFGNFTDVPEEDWIAYREFLEEIKDKLGFASLRIIDLSEMENSVPDFEARFKKKVEELKRLYREKDGEYLKKYEGTFPSVYRIVSTKGYDTRTLMDVYNENLFDREVSEEVRRIREDIRRRAHESIFKYHAYLMVRTDIDYLEKTVPHGLALSVSPKPVRLGVLPVHRDCKRLPYHGVTVYYPEEDLYLIEYLIDIKRRDATYTVVSLEGDEEDKPFYYILN